MTSESFMFLWGGGWPHWQSGSQALRISFMKSPAVNMSENHLTAGITLHGLYGY